MLVSVTKSFRIAEDGGTRKYTPGDVAEGRAAKVALDNAWGKEVPADLESGLKADDGHSADAETKGDQDTDVDTKGGKKAKKTPRNKAVTPGHNKSAKAEG